MLTRNDWESLYRTLMVSADYGTPVARPTQSQLDAFEYSKGFLLPKSYRDFLLVFGPGQISACLLISAPGYLHAIDKSFDLETANEQYKLTDLQIGRFPEELRVVLKRLYYFGFIDGRDWLAWDIEDVRHQDEHEYAIYQISLRRATIIATSFQELIETVCNRLFAPNPNWNEETMGPQRTFQPATYLSNHD